MKKIKKRTRKEIQRIGEYMVAGGAWFWSGYFIIIYLDDRIDLFWAAFAGNAVGITVNFLLERYWVFRTKRPTKFGVAAWRYIIYTAINAFLLNYLILSNLRNVGIEPEIGQFIAAGFFTFWNYIWYKAWVFKGRTRTT
jgi:putative flippase GtrA